MSCQSRQQTRTAGSQDSAGRCAPPTEAEGFHTPLQGSRATADTQDRGFVAHESFLSKAIPNCLAELQYIDGNGKAGVAILARADLRIHSPAEAKVGQGRMEGR